MPTTLTTIPHRTALNRALVTAIAAATSKPCELAAIPASVTYDGAGLLVDPYSIVYPLPGVGSYANLEDVWCVVMQYQVTNIGQNADQAQWMADASRQALTSRNPDAGGVWTQPITASDVLVIDRRLREEGGPEPTGGGLWQVVDTFDLEVSTQ
jgi:hypothetical protein